MRLDLWLRAEEKRRRQETRAREGPRESGILAPSGFPRSPLVGLAAQGKLDRRRKIQKGPRPAKATSNPTCPSDPRTRAPAPSPRPKGARNPAAKRLRNRSPGVGPLPARPGPSPGRAVPSASSARSRWGPGRGRPRLGSGKGTPYREAGGGGRRRSRAGCGAHPGL